MPSRSNTSVKSEKQPRIPSDMSGAASSRALEQARSMGMRYAESWSQLDPVVAKNRSLYAFRAIGYADAVLSFEHSPMLDDLLRAWEAGYADGACAIDSLGTVASTPSQTAEVTPNPYYSNPDRAAYEIGDLLSRLPANYGIAHMVEAQHLQIAAAAEKHACAAELAIWSGIEAIGDLVEMAGANSEEQVSSTTIFSIGGLIKHLAVEGHYMSELSDRLGSASERYSKRGSVAVKGDGHE